LSLAREKILSSPLKKIGVISNWGTLHYQSAKELEQLNVKNLYIEKPIANSFAALNGLKKMSSHVKIIGGFQNRYMQIEKKINSIATNALSGPPSLISVTGGAGGIVTNGIHWLDLAISIFDESPISVTSDLSSSKINPRSNELDFWEGGVIWNFSGNRKFSINFSNLSSVTPTAEIFCPNGKIKLNEDLSIDIYERDKQEIIDDSRVTRLGTSIKTNSKSHQPESKNLFERIFSHFFEEGTINIERELIATHAMLMALTANELGKKLYIDESLDNEYFEKEWSIS
jgi:predicted dehydrogenase